HAARPANTGRTMAAHRNVSAAPNRQRSSTNVKPRTSPAYNRATPSASVTRAKAARPAVNPAAAGPATIRERNLARNERMRERNAQRKQEFRARREVAVNRDRNVAVNRNRNAEVNRERNIAENRTRNENVNRFRNTNEFRNRNNVGINRERNFNRTQNAAFYRGRNARVTNNWRGDAFRGQRYAAFRNYNRNWH